MYEYIVYKDKKEKERPTQVKLEINVTRLMD